MRIKYEIIRGKRVTHRFFRGKRYPPLPPPPPLIDRFARALGRLFRGSRGGTFEGPSVFGGAESGAKHGARGNSVTTEAKYAQGLSGTVYGSRAGTLSDTVVPSGSISGAVAGSRAGTFKASSMFSRARSGAEYDAVGGGAFASDGLAEGAAGCGCFAGSLAGTEVGSVEIIEAGEYALTPPASTYLSEMIHFDLPFAFVLRSTGVTYDCTGLYLSDNLVGGDIGSFLPAGLATRSSGEAWQTITDSITVTEATPVTVDKYAAFALFFTRAGGYEIPAGNYHFRASSPAPAPGREVLITVDCAYEGSETFVSLLFDDGGVTGNEGGGATDLFAVYDDELGKYTGPLGDDVVLTVNATAAVTAEQYAVFFEVFETAESQ